MRDDSHVAVAAAVAGAAAGVVAPAAVVAVHDVAAVGMRCRSRVRSGCLEICPKDLQLVSEIITVVGYEL